MTVNPMHDDPLEPDESLFDPDKARHYFRYAKGSLRRQAALAATLFAAVLGLVLLGLLVFPKDYHVEAKLLAQRNGALAGRNEANAADAPTRAAAETVLRRDNLVSLIQQNDLMRHYAAHRAPAQVVRDAVLGRLQRHPTEEEQLDTMVRLLEKRFNVWSNEGTVTIALDWPDAHMAQKLVDSAQQSFLEARHVQEISALAESVGILQGHVASLHTDVVAAVEAVRALRPETGASRPPREDAQSQEPHPVRVAVAPYSDPELTKLRVMIDTKRRAISDLEEFRHRRVTELQAHLSEQRAVYTENHPTIIDLQQTIASLSAESPQVTSLKKSVAALQAEYDRKAPREASERDASTHASAAADWRSVPAPISSEIAALEREPREERDPVMLSARGTLRDAMEKYAALRAQIQTAQIELETAEAAFKYRYTVVTPARVPTHPSKPNAVLVVVAGILAGAFLAFLAAVVTDVRAGLIVERWQVEMLLDAPILGEVELPALRGGYED